MSRGHRLDYPQRGVPNIKRILGGAVAAIATLLHLWYRGVLAAPEVKRRKAAKRGGRA